MTTGQDDTSPGAVVGKGAEVCRSLAAYIIALEEVLETEDGTDKHRACADQAIKDFKAQVQEIEEAMDEEAANVWWTAITKSPELMVIYPRYFL